MTIHQRRAQATGARESALWRVITAHAVVMPVAINRRALACALTLDDLAAAVGLDAKSGASRYVALLEARGVVRRLGSRLIEVLRPFDGGPR